MFQSDIRFCLKNVVRSKTMLHGETTDRKLCGFYFKLSGLVHYTVNGEGFLIGKGDFLFMPAHCHYIVDSVEPGDYISIHFQSDEMEQYTPKLFKLSPQIDVKELFTEIWKHWIADSDKSTFLCYSLMYQLLFHIASEEERGYMPQQKYNRIAPSVQYLEAHLFDEKLSFTNLHTYSGVSYVYFEKLFKAFFHTSPMQYVMHKRIHHARKTFESGEFATVSQVAADVGYSDSLYFSRLFKKQTGLSPSAYIEQQRMKE